MCSENKGVTEAEQIKQAVFSLAFAAVAGGLMLAFFPDCSLRKTFKAAVLAFVLSCAVSPLAGLSGDFVPQIGADGPISAEITDSAAAGAEKVIAQSIAASLNEAGIMFDGIEASVTADSDGRLYITEIRVRDPGGENAKELNDHILKNYGITPVLGE